MDSSFLKARALRRLRGNPHIRSLTQEVHVSASQMIQPHFVVQGLTERVPVPGLTDVYRETSSSLVKQVEADMERGARKFILFPVPAEKKERGFDVSFTCQQISALKKAFGKDMWLALDVCLCSATSHGHCGILTPEMDHVDNGATIKVLAEHALAYAQAGADCVAPSDMMDGRIGAIRQALDGAGSQALLMSYSAKFNSKFYGPFRVAADSAPRSQALKDRATYQIDPARPKDALLASWRDAEEGADILMVKPGMPYLDILKELSSEIPLPWAVYEVSGEYAAMETLAAQGLMDGPAAHLEAWTALKRAGASMIITYGARHAAAWIKEREAAR